VKVEKVGVIILPRGISRILVKASGNYLFSVKV
jgi:hypothetical protein